MERSFLISRKPLKFFIIVIVLVLSIAREVEGSSSNLSFPVGLDANGGEVSGNLINVTYKGKYGALPTPTRKNYQFMGWYSSRHAGVKITSESTVSKPSAHKLYARWVGNAFTVTLNPNGGNLIKTTLAIRYGTKNNFPIPTRENYNFIGWYTALKGGDKITSKTIVGDDFKTTLYAQWEEKKLNISFIAFNGDEVIVREVTCGKAYGELPLPVREGKKFVGWFTWKDYTNENAIPITASTIVTEKDKRKLFARWI